MDYREALADLDEVIQDIGARIGRLGSAVDSVAQAVAAHPRGGPIDQDSLRYEALRLGDDIDEARRIHVRLVDLLSFVERSAAAPGILPLPEAKQLLDAMNGAVEHLALSWSELESQLRTALMRIEVDTTVGAGPRWDEHWPADAATAQDLSRRLLSERDSLILLSYYEKGLTQDAIAKSIGLSQPAIATRLANVAAMVSAEIAAIQFQDRYGIPTLPPRSPRQAFRIGERFQAGRHVRVLVLPSDRLMQKPPLRFDLREIGHVTALAVYVLVDGIFRLAPGADLGSVAIRVPFPDQFELADAFRLNEPPWS